MWCTIMNGSLLMLSALHRAIAADGIYRIQSKWFKMRKENIFFCNRHGWGDIKLVKWGVDSL